MRNKAKYVIAATALLSTSTLAATPENGWWWNPAESGTGWNLEFQNGTMFASTFIYDDAGNPAWYSGSGQVNRNNMVTIELLRSTGGPCLECQYSQVVTGGTGKSATFRFSDDGHGTVTIGQQNHPIQRFNFNYGDGAQKMLGVWSVSIVAPVISGMGLSDVVSYTGFNSDGMAQGRRIFNNSHATVAAPVGNDGLFLMTTKVNSSEYMMSIYIFSGLNRLVGLSRVFNNSVSGGDAVDQIIDNGLLFIGNRNANSGDISTKSASTEPSDDGLMMAVSDEAMKALDQGAINAIEDKVKLAQ